MAKQDLLKNKLAGTTKKTIGKKTIPPEPNKAASSSVKPKTISSSEKTTQVNFRMAANIRFQAKITAMEMGKSLKDYITDLIVTDLKSRGKI